MKWSASLSWVVTDVHYWDHPGDRGEMTSVTKSGRDSSNDLGHIRTYITQIVGISGSNSAVDVQVNKAEFRKVAAS